VYELRYWILERILHTHRFESLERQTRLWPPFQNLLRGHWIPTPSLPTLFKTFMATGPMEQAYYYERLQMLPFTLPRWLMRMEN